MADTRRTVAALQALFPDNATGDISPQDLRDFLVSASSAHGIMYISSSAETTISVAGTAVKAAGTTASANASSDVTVATTNRMTYTAAPTIEVIIEVAASLSCAGTNKDVAISIAKNGTVIAHSVIERGAGSANAKGAYPVLAFAELAQNDYIEVWVQNDDSTDNVTLHKCVVVLRTMLV